MGGRDQITELTRRLLDLTRDGTIEWSTTDEPDSYLLARESGNVVVGSRDGDGTAPYVIRVTDPQGTIVASESTESWTELTELDHLLEALLQQARASARGATRVFNNLIEELDEIARDRPRF